MNTYKLTLIAILAAVGIAGRVYLVILPNVQPVTAIIIVAGIVMGPGAAILLAVVITFLSNMLLGMGIWTIWQILSWGIIGLISGIIGKFFRDIPLFLLILYGVFAGYFYGFVISLTQFAFFEKFWPYYIAGLPFDTYHAIGNAIFIIILYPLIKILTKNYANSRFKIQQ